MASVGRGGTGEDQSHALASAERHWNDADFLVLQIDFKNALNTVSRKAVIEAVTEFFPGLLPGCSGVADERAEGDHVGRVKT